MQIVYDPVSGTIQYMAEAEVTTPQPLQFVANIAERNTLPDTVHIVWGQDASADPTVESDGALYGRDKNGGWVKLSEAESMDTPQGLINPMTNLGDLIAGGHGGQPIVLHVGVEGMVLRISGGVPVWDYPHIDAGEL